MLNTTSAFDIFGYSVNFERTWVYFLLPALFVLVILPYFLTPRRKRGGVSHIVAMVIRCLAVTVATVILSGVTFTEIKTEPDEVSLVVIADYSDSVGDISDQIENYVGNLVMGTNERTKVCIIKFSNNATSVTTSVNEDGETEYFTYDKNMAVDSLGKRVSEEIGPYDSTDLAGAIRLGTKILRDESTIRRIVVVSDGRETRGNAAAAAAEAAAQSPSIKVDTVLFDITQMDEDIFSEVAILSVGVLPDHVLDVGKTARVTVKLYSSIDMKGRLEFYVDDEEEPVEKMPVSLVKGDNNVFNKSYNTANLSQGVHELRVKFVPADRNDSIRENNTLSTWIKLNGGPKVLVVGTDSSATDKLSEQVVALYGEGSCDVRNPFAEDMPKTMQALLKYDEVVLVNVAKDQLPYTTVDGVKDYYFERHLQNYVGNVGRGLFTTTGTDEQTYMSYGGEGWKDADKSPLAQMLPMKMTLDETLYNTAIVIVIDDSSSMLDGAFGTVDKFEPAKKGAIKVIEALGEHDYVGIVTFHQEATLHLDMTKPTNKEELYTLVNGLSAENHFGTDYSKGLDMARDMLRNFNDARSKHVIFLTDGYPTLGEWENIPTYMKNAGIKLHTIALMTDNSAKELLKGMADAGDGNSYSVDKEEDLKNVASVMQGWTEDAKEPEFINKEPFNPLVGDDTGVLNMVDAAEMTLGGYIGSTLKEGAQMALHTKDFRPLIAEWDYGNGHVTSVLTDMTGDWGKAFFAAENNGFQLVKNLIKQSLNDDVQSTGLTANIIQEESTAHITVTSETDEIGIAVITVNKKSEQATTEKPDASDKIVVTLRENGGKYRGSFEMSDPGYVYEIDIVLYAMQKDSDGNPIRGDYLDATKLAYASGVIAEYDIFNIDGESIMKSIAAAGEGGVRENDSYTKLIDDLFISDELKFPKDALLPMAVTLGILIVLDILVRHINFDRLFRERKRKKEESI